MKNHVSEILNNSNTLTTNQSQGAACGTPPIYSTILIIGPWLICIPWVIKSAEPYANFLYTSFCLNFSASMQLKT